MVDAASKEVGAKCPPEKVETVKEPQKLFAVQYKSTPFVPDYYFQSFKEFFGVDSPFDPAPRPKFPVTIQKGGNVHVVHETKEPATSGGEASRSTEASSSMTATQAGPSKPPPPNTVQAGPSQPPNPPPPNTVQTGPSQLPIPPPPVPSPITDLPEMTEQRTRNDPSPVGPINQVSHPVLASHLNNAQASNLNHTQAFNLNNPQASNPNNPQAPKLEVFRMICCYQSCRWTSVHENQEVVEQKMQEHIAETHLNFKPFLCVPCRELHCRQKFIENHHANTPPYARFSSLAQATEHVKRVHNNIQIRVEIENDEKMQMSLDNAMQMCKRTMRKVYSNSAKPIPTQQSIPTPESVQHVYLCRCGFRSANVTEIKIHMVREHLKLPLVTCPLCKASASIDKDLMQKHIRERHGFSNAAPVWHTDRENRLNGLLHTMISRAEITKDNSGPGDDSGDVQVIHHLPKAQQDRRKQQFHQPPSNFINQGQQFHPPPLRLEGPSGAHPVGIAPPRPSVVCSNPFAENFRPAACPPRPPPPEASHLQQRICLQCGEKVLNQSSQKRCHIALKHLGKDLIFCPFCSFSTPWFIQAVRNHMLRAHPEVRNPDKVNIVDKRDQVWTELNEYEAVCFPLENQPLHTTPAPEKSSGVTVQATEGKQLLLQDMFSEGTGPDPSLAAEDALLNFRPADAPVQAPAGSAQCQKCNSMVSIHSSIRPHVLRHIGRQLIRCPICPFSDLCTPSTVKRHMESMHRECKLEIIDLRKKYQKEYEDERQKCFPKDAIGRYIRAGNNSPEEGSRKDGSEEAGDEASDPLDMSRKKKKRKRIDGEDSEDSDAEAPALGYARFQAHVPPPPSPEPAPMEVSDISAAIEQVEPNSDCEPFHCEFCRRGFRDLDVAMLHGLSCSLNLKSRQGKVKVMWDTQIELNLTKLEPPDETTD